MGPDFFIFGSERGGTTLLSALLSSHPGVYVLNDSFLYLAWYEIRVDRERSASGRAAGRLTWLAKDCLRRCGFLFRLLQRLRGRVGLSWRPQVPDCSLLPGGDHRVDREEAAALVARLRVRYDQYQPDDGGRAPFLQEYARRLGEAPGPGGEEEQGAELVAYLDRLFRLLLPQEARDLPLLGEKTPRHLYLAPWLRRLHPRAKVITLMRNPVANVACLHARLGGDLAAALAKYRSFHSAALQEIYRPGTALVLRYEDLLRRTGETLAAAADWLGLAQAPGTDPGSYARPEYVGGAIDPGRDRARMDYFDGPTRRRILAECAPLVERWYPDLEELYR